MEEWLNYDLFTWEWWLLVAVFILPWILFIKLVKKKYLPQTILYGTFIVIISESFDHIGYELGLWTYTVEILPLFPRFEEVNFSVLPVTYMLLYQYFPDWKPFTISLVIAAAAFTFIAEPALMSLGLYEVLNWKPAYGFPIYVSIGLFVKWLVQTIYAIAQKREN